jgi:NAD(P)-dependent dehydrogenase (short-subunit alcohol dehydrogenase family)
VISLVGMTSQIDTGDRPVILVTGGSRGIGAATAIMAADRGYRVIVNYRDNRAAADLVVSAVERAGSRGLALQADVAIESDVERLFANIDERVGRLDALVNNAGTLATQMAVADMPGARILRTLSVNVLGPFLCAREAVRRMSTTRGGRGGAIVNVSSRAAQYGSPREYVDYAASKGALETFTTGLAREVADQGIRVNAVRVGHVYTEIHASGGEPHRVDRVKQAVPMKRGGQPEEVARAILWLLSEDASYSTGAFLDVSGGRYSVRRNRDAEPGATPPLAECAGNSSNGRTIGKQNRTAAYGQDGRDDLECVVRRRGRASQKEHRS